MKEDKKDLIYILTIKEDKSPELLSTDEWWSTEIPWQPSQQTSPFKSSMINDIPKEFRKTIVSLCLTQQLKML